MTWLDAARRVVANKQYEVINPTTGEPVPTEWVPDDDDTVHGEKLVAKNDDGVLLDGTTANLLVQVHDALGEEARAKFLSMDVVRAADISWKLVK
jgi:hypothetical protein